MRSFTTPMTTFLSNRTNLEPVTIIGIDWTDDGAETMYADRDIYNIAGKILGVGNLDNVLSTKTGQSASINVKLDDIDGTIKSYLDQIDVYGVACTVYQTFNDATLSIDDKITLFRGQITYDVKWSEGQRTVDLSILTEVEDREVGFSPEEGQFDFVSPDSVGKAWPLCFGSPLHVPAVKVKQATRMVLNDRFCIVDPVLYYKRYVLSEGIYANYSLYAYYVNLAMNGNNLEVSATDLLWQFLDLLRRRVLWQTEAHKLRKEVNRLKDTIAAIRKGKNPWIIQLIPGLRAQQARAQERLDKYMLQEPLTVGQAFRVIVQQLPAIQADIKVKQQAAKAQIVVIQQISKLYREYLQVQLEICKQERCVDNTLHVKDGKYFDQAPTEIEVFINNFRFKGTVENNLFTYTNILPKYAGITLAARQTLDAVCDDPIEEYATFWVPNTSYQLKGMYALIYSNITGHRHIIKIVEQVGTKCTMELVNNEGKTQSDEINALLKGQKISSLVVGSAGSNPYPVLNIPMPRLLGPGAFNSNIMARFSNWAGQIYNMAYSSTPTSANINAYINNNIGVENISPEAWNILNRLIMLDNEARAMRTTYIGDLRPDYAFTVSAFDFDTLIEVSPVVMLHWLTDDILADEIPKSAAWSAEQGTEIVDATESCEIHVANILESEVKSVSAYRVNEDGVRSITTIPSSYYTTQIEELHTTSSVPFELTTVRVHTPLTQLNEHWEDQIYVSLVSEKGPNVADIIEHLVITYTDKSVDTASFEDVRASQKAGGVDIYPANFAILERKNVFEQINEIAYQARCVAYIIEDVYYLRYLSAKPTSVGSIGVDKVEQGSMTVGYSDLTDIATRMTAIWKPDYLEDTEENRLTLRHNIGKYGLHEREIDFYIYNIEELVVKSATYWLIQNCNSWKYVELTVPISQLKIELFDAITVILPGLITGDSILGIVEEFDYDSENNNVKVTIRLAVRSGEMSEYKFAWPSTTGLTDEFPEDLDIQSGYVGSGNPIISGTLEDC